MANAADTKATDTTRDGTPVVVDFGKKRGKRIKELREGRGKLMDEVNGLMAELRANGTVAASAQPVIIVVREKRKTLRWPLS